MIIGELGNYAIKSNKQLNAFVGIDTNDINQVVRKVETQLISVAIKKQEDYCFGWL